MDFSGVQSLTLGKIDEIMRNCAKGMYSENIAIERITNLIQALQSFKETAQDYKEVEDRVREIERELEEKQVELNTLTDAKNVQYSAFMQFIGKIK